MTRNRLAILFSQFWTNLCSKSGFNCSFLTHIQVSQEARKVVWYSLLFKNFPQFIVIHTFKGFSILREAQVNAFLGLSCCFLWFSGCWRFDHGSLPFPNLACTSGNSWFTTCWSLAWMILSVTMLACKMSATVKWFEHSLALPLFGIQMKTNLFQSYGHC